MKLQESTAQLLEAEHRVEQVRARAEGDAAMAGRPRVPAQASGAAGRTLSRSCEKSLSEQEIETAITLNPSLQRRRQTASADNNGHGGVRGPDGNIAYLDVSVYQIRHMDTFFLMRQTHRTCTRLGV